MLKSYTFSALKQLYWDEDDRLQGEINTDYGSYYFYDYSGERTWKAVGQHQIVTTNGRTYDYVTFNQSTLYLFPEVTITPQGYTKHIFAGTERICSKIGMGGANNNQAVTISLTNTQINNKKSAQFTMLEKVYSGLCIPWPPAPPLLGQACRARTNTMGYDPLKNKLDSINTRSDFETTKYFYSTNHLGSSSWITNAQGDGIQHLSYDVWGSIFQNQKSTSFDSDIKFSAKPFDNETKYYYYGARYYDPDGGYWLSVDRLANRYPMFSGYVFCGNSPVMLYDPDGNKIKGVTYNQQTNSFNYTAKAIARGTNRYIEARCKTASGTENIMRMYNSRKTYKLHVTNKPMFVFNEEKNGYSQILGIAEKRNNIYVSTAPFHNNTDFANSLLINDTGNSSNINMTGKNILPQLKDMNKTDKYYEAYRDSGLEEFENQKDANGNLINTYKTEQELIHGVAAHEEVHTEQGYLDVYNAEFPAMQEELKQRQDYQKEVYNNGN